MLEELDARRINAPQYRDLRDLAQHILRRRAELQKELQLLEWTLMIISKSAGLHINLNGNKIEE